MSGTVTLRLSLSGGADGKAVRRLASLGGAMPPDGPVVLAEVDSQPVAALAMADATAVADPLPSRPAVVIPMHLRRLKARLIGSIWATEPRPPAPTPDHIRTTNEGPDD